LAAQAQETRGILESERIGGAQSGIFAERMAGHKGRLRSRVEALFGLENPQRRDARRQQRRLSVGGEGELRLGPFKHERGKLLVERGVDAVEHLARDWELVRQRLSHADRLRPLTWKHQGR
jgi:hypothetical protein